MPHNPNSTPATNTYRDDMEVDDKTVRFTETVRHDDNNSTTTTYECDAKDYALYLTEQVSKQQRR
ncbi:hypothetical protein [Nostoc sp.]|uniref:hypothetical protein n=1 Tax=Nostoc sp. TaxID=1180 RepID=UPI002FF80FD6